MTMKVNLTSAAEVPPNTSPGKGTADLTYDTASKMLPWKVTYSGLTGPATMAHFHGPAEAGKNAAVLIPFKDAASGAEGNAQLAPQKQDATSGGNTGWCRTPPRRPRRSICSPFLTGTSSSTCGVTWRGRVGAGGRTRADGRIFF